jgi:hypothetical protein
MLVPPLKGKRAGTPDSLVRSLSAEAEKAGHEQEDHGADERDHHGGDDRVPSDLKADLEHLGENATQERA